MGKNINFTSHANNHCHLRIGKERFWMMIERDMVYKLSELVNGHWAENTRSMSDTKAVRIKLTNTDDETLYLTTWLLPTNTSYKILIIWEKFPEGFLVEMTFDYKSFRKEFLKEITELNKIVKKGEKNV